jgi:hypothetical protein
LRLFLQAQRGLEVSAEAATALQMPNVPIMKTQFWTLARRNFRRKRASGLDYLILDSVSDQLADRMHFEFAHDIGPVRFRSFDADP